MVPASRTNQSADRAPDVRQRAPAKTKGAPRGALRKEGSFLCRFFLYRDIFDPPKKALTTAKRAAVAASPKVGKLYSVALPGLSSRQRFLQKAPACRRNDPAVQRVLARPKGGTEPHCTLSP